MTLLFAMHSIQIWPIVAHSTCSVVCMCPCASDGHEHDHGPNAAMSRGIFDREPVLNRDL